MEGFNSEKYSNGAKGVAGLYTLYVEGKCSKDFYGELDEIKGNFLVQNGFNCSEIRKKVQKEIYSYGIIDKDYTCFSDKKLFPIDFYSIENIALLYIPQLQTLKSELISLYKTQPISKCSEYKLQGLIIRHPTTKMPKEFQLEISNTKHDEQFSSYLKVAFDNELNFTRYKDVKDVVINYLKFAKQINVSMKKVNYIKDLVNYLPEKSISYIFSTNILKEITKII